MSRRVVAVAFPLLALALAASCSSRPNPDFPGYDGGDADADLDGDVDGDVDRDADADVDVDEDVDEDPDVDVDADEERPCNAETCPHGCCEGGECRGRSVETCGVAGATCFACDPLLANSCSAEGECLCGAAPACAPSTECVGGRCACTPTSCPDGCCWEDDCRVRDPEACGIGGDACVRCDPLGADTCTVEGECACGAESPCPDGQRCVGGECVCDATSCPEGCCEAGRCYEDDFDHCGTGGGRCTHCDDERADRCDDGECRCRFEPQCSEDERCGSMGCWDPPG